MTSVVRSKAVSSSELRTWGLGAELQDPGDVEEDVVSSLDTTASSHPEGGWHEAVHVHDLTDTQLEELWPRGRTHKALFLDYDGTLREFETRPELAVPSPEVHELLAALCAREDLVVHIISGRDADFLSTHLGRHRRLTLIAEHERRLAGRFQIWRPGACAPRERSVSASEDWKQLVRPEMEKLTERLPGSQVEEKASALVWHHRGAANKAIGEVMAEALQRQVEHLRELYGEPLQRVKVCIGHKTVEVSCRTVSKGEVMRRICQDRAAAHGPFDAVLVAGDDVSDESMFWSAPQDFLTVKVGAAETGARFRVDNPRQLRDLLWRLAKE